MGHFFTQVGIAFTFFADHVAGIIALLITLFALLVITQYAMWLFRVGRFKGVPPAAGGGGAPGGGTTIQYTIVRFFVELVNDFKHLLALVIVGLFAAALFITLYKAGDDFKNVRDAVQVVAASLGGLVGSIIGYYFGESAAQKAKGGRPPPELTQQPDVAEVRTGTPPITPATAPPDVGPRTPTAS